MRKWFKFYGGEYLSDPKIMSLSPAERSCWVTLLCLASTNDDNNDNGIVRYLTEERLMIFAGLDTSMEEWEKTKNILEKFKSLGMIQNDNGEITLRNWQKRQETSLTPYERVKRYREKKKKETVDNKNGNDRLDKIRLDKKRKDITSIATPSVAEPINEFLGLFKEINPSFEQLYANKTQRASAQRLLVKFGFEAMKRTITVIEKTNGMQYAPVITTPLELEKLGGKLKAFLTKEKQESLKNKIISI